VLAFRAKPDLASAGKASGLIALSLLAWACAATGAIPRPFPTPPTTVDAPISEPTAVGDSGLPGSIPLTLPVTPINGLTLAGTALDLRGIRYRSGGADPSGFDCSGFTRYVFAQHNVVLPRAVRDQFDVGKAVNQEEVEPGDLLFFTTTAPGASHVAIALGGGEFVHAPSSAGVVRVERLSSSYWSRRFVGARRVSE
jgi:cell wall-associated NlpC family hydrolase